MLLQSVDLKSPSSKGKIIITAVGTASTGNFVIGGRFYLDSVEVRNMQGSTVAVIQKNGTHSGFMVLYDYDGDVRFALGLDSSGDFDLTAISIDSND